MKFFREPTKEPSSSELRKERSILFTLIADILITILQFVAMVLSGSLTMLSESIRCLLMDIVEIYSYWMLRGVHRGRMHHFQFGVGKIEQFAWLIIGTALLLSGLWLAVHVIQTVFEYQQAPSPVGLAFAAVVNAINLLINCLSLYAIISASDRKESDIFRAQRRARALKTLTSAILQITLTIAAISSDPVVAKVLDGVGALVVAGVMSTTGGAMVARSLPDLLDAPLNDTAFNRILSAVADTAGSTADVAAVRTRRSGRFPQVEITLSHDNTNSLQELKTRIQELRHSISELDEDIELSIVLTDDNGK